jgi:protein gp37
VGKVTGIEWTDATWNPIRGCSRVSEGCRNCYAEKIAGRFRGAGLPYEGLTAITNGKPVWNGQIQFVEDRLLDPLRWKPVFVACEVCGLRQYQCACEKFNHRSRRIFVNSMSDLFHENVHEVDRTLIFAVMLLCPQHTFQVLTKRPERMLAWLSEPGRRSAILKAASMLAFDLQSLKVYARIPKPWNATDVVYDCGPNGDEAGCRVRDAWPLPNVWLGVSVENQKAADERIPLLLQTPAAVRLISAEPLLGHLRLDGFLRSKPRDAVLDWVICGGESGSGARPMHPDWARGLRNQCVAAGVPFFFKQWGEWLGYTCSWNSVKHIKTGILWPIHVWPEHSPEVTVIHRDTPIAEGCCKGSLVEFERHDVASVRCGKKLAGDLLDEKQWHQFPEVRA